MNVYFDEIKAHTKFPKGRIKKTIEKKVKDMRRLLRRNYIYVFFTSCWIDKMDGIFWPIIYQTLACFLPHEKQGTYFSFIAGFYQSELFMSWGGQSYM